MRCELRKISWMVEALASSITLSAEMGPFFSFLSFLLGEEYRDRSTLADVVLKLVMVENGRREKCAISLAAKFFGLYYSIGLLRCRTFLFNSSSKAYCMDFCVSSVRWRFVSTGCVLINVFRNDSVKAISNPTFTLFGF
jgi:hypothetical protein